MTNIKRTLWFYLALMVLIIVVGMVMGAPFTLRLLVEAFALSLIALGLNI